jgi:hypothetical protein
MAGIITLILYVGYELIYHYNKEKKRDKSQDHYGIDILHWDSRL